MNINKARRSKASLLRSIAHHTDAVAPCSISERLLRAERLRFVQATSIKAITLTKCRPYLEHSVEDLVRIAEEVDVLAPFEGTVPWRYKSRKSGPPRLVCDLPAPLRLAHELAAELITAQLRPRQHIFNWPGRGRDRLASALAQAINNHGRHIIVADVKRCFSSVNPDAIAGLDLLPPELIRNALDYRSLRFRRYGDIPEMPDGGPYVARGMEQSAPRGLLEGSAASDPLIAALFNDLPDHMEGNVIPFLFSDNIAVVARSAEECSQSEKHLVRYFTDHHAGPFSLRFENVDLKRGFDFLGYRFSLNDTGEAQVDVSMPNWAKAMRRLYKDMDLTQFESPEAIVSEMLLGFTAVSPEQVEAFRMLAADELFHAATLTENADLGAG